jgi:hypothetical protein
MSSRLRLRGSVTLSTPQDVLTVQDVKDFLVALEQMGVPDTAEILDGFLHFDWSSAKIDIIECGEHLVGEADQFDFVLTTHECKSESHTD